MTIEKHVVLFSSGAGSSWVGKYVTDKFGKENTILLHTDTKWEDEDNYRFMEECSKYIGVPITYSNDGRTPEDIFKEHNYFGNFGTAPCSKKLKMKKTFEFIQDLFTQGIKPILYFGIDHTEVRRAPRIAYNYKHNVDVFEEGLEVRFPLIGEVGDMPVNGEHLLWGTDYLYSESMPKLFNDAVFGSLEAAGAVISDVIPKKEIQEQWGIELPRMYAYGFSHANCGGRCIKAGKKHFKTLHEVWPDRYLELENIEQEINKKQIEKNGRRYTILSQAIQKEGSKKKSKIPYSLKEYREEILEKKDCKITITEEDVPCECVF